MIKKLEIDGVHMTISEDLNRYVLKKIGKLDKYIPRRSRESVHVQVKLKESKIKTKQQRTCEVVMHLPNETITISETTLNMFAAVDIVEAKLKNQIKAYKDKHAVGRLRRRFVSRIRKKSA